MKHKDIALIANLIGCLGFFTYGVISYLFPILSEYPTLGQIPTKDAFQLFVCIGIVMICYKNVIRLERE